MQVKLSADIGEITLGSSTMEIQNEADVQDMAQMLMRTLYIYALGYSGEEVAKYDFFAE